MTPQERTPRSASRPPRRQGQGQNRRPMFQRSRGRSTGDRQASLRQYVGSPRATQLQKPQTAAAPTTLKGAEGKVIITVLGGLEEVGRNMTMIEYIPTSGDPDILIIDMGLQFPEEDTPGIDYIIPNITCLKGREKLIRGVVITHGHYDHIGAIPYLSPRLGDPPIFGLPLTCAIIKKRQDDFQNAPLNLHVVAIDDVLTLGRFVVEFIHINHNIPDSSAIVVRTPVGTLVHTGDWKFDYTPADEKPADFAKLARIGTEGIAVLMGDSTNAGQLGHQMSEREIGKSLQQVVTTAPGRVIIGTFSSLLSRIDQVIGIAQKFGKKIAIDGYSMRINVEIIQQLGYTKIQPGTLIDVSQVDDYPKNKIIIMCTGAQGEDRAVLMRIANNEHRHLHIEPDDTVIFSSSVIPGNERTVQRLKDTLYRKGAEVVHYQMMDVHAGGHAKNEDIKLMLSLTKPKYYFPIEGNHSFLRLNAKVAAEMGFPKDRVIIADNGQGVELTATAEGPKVHVTNNRVPTDYVMVDGLGVGDVSQIVLRDRQVLAADGMVVVIATIEKRTGKLIGSPDIISRGFVYMKENKEIIEETRFRVKKMVHDRDSQSAADENYIKNKIRDGVGQFLFQRTERRPMILPVVIEI